ncbi:uncharacterized protein [Penaeus vannamei]|uniref:uncharacterized protein n=1 Tax=Penaeus vannamei TaxID=6689 RepID=UPI00387F660A
MAFVDYEKAFDSIKHKAVFEALDKQGGRQKCVNILKQDYKNGMEEIFKRVELNVGKNINGEKIYNLRFADIILFVESEEQLRELLIRLIEEGKKDCMKINKEKTNIMCNVVVKGTPRQGINVDNERLKEMKEYMYL